MNNATTLIQPKEQIHVDELDGSVVFTTEQEIPSQFVDRIKDARTAEPKQNTSDVWEIAEIPTSVIDSWYRRGLDIHRMSAREILAKLNAENLGAFITTSKVI